MKRDNVYLTLIHRDSYNYSLFILFYNSALYLNTIKILICDDDFFDNYILFLWNKNMINY